MSSQNERQAGPIGPRNSQQLLGIVSQVSERGDLAFRTLTQAVADEIDCPEFDFSISEGTGESMVLTAVLATTVQKNHSDTG